MTLCAILKNLKRLLNTWKKPYTMKGVGYPQFYLGGVVVDLPPTWKDHNVSFGLSAHTYIKNCTENLERMCDTTFKSYSVPMDPLYHAETDVSDLYSSADHSKYRSLLEGLIG